MNIYIIFTNSIPSNNAYANRICTLVKGLSELHNNVCILNSYVGNEKNDINTKPFKKYRIQNANYINLIGITKKPKMRVLQIIFGAFGIINTCLYLLLIRKIDYVILCADTLDWIIPLKIFSKIKSFKLIREQNEYPRYYQHPEYYKNKLLIAKRSRYSMFDAFIFMTHRLDDFFKQNGYKGKSIILPMTVDLERFEGIPKNEDNLYITYVGTLYGNKDGLGDLINAYALLINKNKDLKERLRIIGDNSQIEELKYIYTLIEQYGIKYKVVFTGSVTRDKVPFLLKNSKLLVLARPNHLQAEGGFPTKLGEYLATANPVVVTRVGEIDKYLIDKQSVFFAEPDNPEDFADKMSEVLSNPLLAEEVGKNGRKVAETVFNYKVQAVRLHNFLKTL